MTSPIASLKEQAFRCVVENIQLSWLQQSDNLNPIEIRDIAEQIVHQAFPKENTQAISLKLSLKSPDCFTLNSPEYRLLCLFKGFRVMFSKTHLGESLASIVERDGLKSTNLVDRNGSFYPSYPPTEGNALIERGQALSTAVKENWDPAAVSLLLATGPIMEADKTAAFSLAVKSGRTEIVAVLLEAGPISGKDKALALATEGGHIKIVALLLNSGISEETISRPLMAAVENGHLKIVQLLLSRTSEVYRGLCLEMLARDGHSEAVRLCLDLEVSEQAREKAKIWATMYGHSEIVRLLD